MRNNDALAHAALAAASAPDPRPDLSAIFAAERERMIDWARKVDPPKIRYRERADVAGFVLDAVGDLARKVRNAEETLLAKVAILYPPLPDGYVWIRETLVEDSPVDFRSTYGVRYRVKHVDDLAPGETGFRP
jgi:hypothetical protein